MFLLVPSKRIHFRVPLRQRHSISTAFFYLSLNVPNKGAPLKPPGTLQRDAHISAFLYTLHAVPSGGPLNDYLSLKVPGKGALPPLQVPQLVPPMEKDAHFQAFFYISLYREKKNSFVPCPQSPASVPSSDPEPAANLTSPWMSTGAFETWIPSSLGIQDHSKLYLGVTSHPKHRARLFKSALSSCYGAPAERDTPFPEPFIYALLHSYLSESLVREPSHETRGKTITIHDALCGQKAYICWGMAWFLKGIMYDNSIITPVSSSLWHNTFHLGLGEPEPCYPVCHSNSLLGIPLYTCYHLPHDSAYTRPAHIRVILTEHFLHIYFYIHITLRYGWRVGFMRDKLLVYYTMKAAGQEEWGNNFKQLTSVTASSVHSDTQR